MALVKPAVMSNVERQRAFRARNPGYRNRFRRPGLTPQQNAEWVASLVCVPVPVANEAAALTTGPADGDLQPEPVTVDSSAPPMVWFASA